MSEYDFEAEQRHHNRELELASPEQLALARELQRLGFSDDAKSALPMVGEFNPGPLYLTQAKGLADPQARQALLAAIDALAKRGRQ